MRQDVIFTSNICEFRPQEHRDVMSDDRFWDLVKDEVLVCVRDSFKTQAKGQLRSASHQYTHLLKGSNKLDPSEKTQGYLDVILTFATEVP